MNEEPSYIVNIRQLAIVMFELDKLIKFMRNYLIAKNGPYIGKCILYYKYMEDKDYLDYISNAVDQANQAYKVLIKAAKKLEKGKTKNWDMGSILERLTEFNDFVERVELNRDRPTKVMNLEVFFGDMACEVHFVNVIDKVLIIEEWV